MILDKAEFLSQLFKFPIAQVLEWNSTRTPHDSKRFIYFLHALYAFYKTRLHPKPSVSVEPHRASGETDDTIPVDERRTAGIQVGIIKDSSSTSSINSIAWSRRQAKCRESSATDDTPTSNASYFTSLSRLTATTRSSHGSMPMPVYSLDFKSHRRAIAANRRTWNPKFNHLMSTQDSPIFPTQMCASTRKSGSSLDGSCTDKSNIQSVFSSIMITLVDEFLRKSTDTQRSEYIRCIRALHSFRRLTHYDSGVTRDFCVADDAKVWSPRRAVPVILQRDLMRSTVPIGSFRFT
jgi:hypothetical protein